MNDDDPLSFGEMPAHAAKWPYHAFSRGGHVWRSGHYYVEFHTGHKYQVRDMTRLTWFNEFLPCVNKGEWWNGEIIRAAKYRPLRMEKWGADIVNDFSTSPSYLSPRAQRGLTIDQQPLEVPIDGRGEVHVPWWTKAALWYDHKAGSLRVKNPSDHLY